MNQLRVLSLAAIIAALTLQAAPAYAADLEGSYHPVSPARVLDTRTGNGAPKVAVGAGRTVSVQVLGRGEVPRAGVAAVVATVTAVAPTAASSYLTVFPSGAARPTVSSLNTIKGQTRANTITAPVGADGKISIFNSAGATHVLLDVVGYYTATDTDDGSPPGALLFPSHPQRVFDSRTDGGPVEARDVVYLDLQFGARNPNVEAVAVNLTVTKPTTGGHLVVWDGTDTLPGTSTLNFQAGQTVANNAVVPTSACGDACDDPDLATLAIYNASAGATQIVVDLVGVYATDDTGLRFRAVKPTRIVDTRTGRGGGQRFGPNTTQLFEPGAVAKPETLALAGNLTAVTPSTSTYLTVWDTETKPGISQLNAPPRQTVANGALITTRDPNFPYFNISNRHGNVDVLVDITGRFDDPTLSSRAAPSTRAAHARAGETRYQLDEVDSRRVRMDQRRR